MSEFVPLSEKELASHVDARTVDAPDWTVGKDFRLCTSFWCSNGCKRVPSWGAGKCGAAQFGYVSWRTEAYLLVLHAHRTFLK